MNKKEIEKILKEIKTGLQELYGPRLKGLFLYGSYSRGDQKPESDLDILIILDQFLDRYGIEVDRTGFLISDLSLKYGVSVSRVFVTEEDWKNRDSLFLNHVREEALAA